METQKKSKQNLFSWSITSDELKYQVDHYSNLKITKSYRGISVLLMLGVVSLTFVLSFFGIITIDGYILTEIIIYLVALYFVYKGNRSALILIMLLWTADKGLGIYNAVIAGTGIWSSIIWWLIIMPYLYKALRVENERKKLQPQIVIPTSDIIFCPKCGSREEQDTRFCSNCGFKLNGIRTN